MQERLRSWFIENKPIKVTRIDRRLTVVRLGFDREAFERIPQIQYRYNDKKYLVQVEVEWVYFVKKHDL